MALQKDLDFNGVTVSNAYWKVNSMIVAKHHISINVEVFANSSAEQMIDSFSYRMAYDPNGGEPLTQAYNYLKSLPEYAGATDV